MKKNICLPLLLIAVAVLISGCGSQQTYDTLPPGQNVLNLPTDAPVYVEPPPESAPTPYIDPTAEEDEGGYTGGVYDEYGNPIYPGATPIAIVPVDLPTPTPRPTLTFSYEAYQSAKLGIAFEAPMGWVVDDSAPDAFRLTEPESQMREGYRAFIDVSVTTVPTTFKVSQIEAELAATLDTIGKAYSTFSKRQSASRTLFNGAANGRYNQYSAVMYDGTAVAGRVHIVLKDNKLYIVHISCPGNFSESYFKLHTQLRSTLKAI